MLFVIGVIVTTSNVAALLRQYDRPGPRYTSYPTAVEFNDSFDDAAYRGRLAAAADAEDDPLSLYVHLPFCEVRCAYCGCMVIITQKREVAARYLDYLEREIAMLAARLGKRRRLVQHHWGGGTPTYLEPAQLRRLHAIVGSHFDFDPDAEVAIEIDPRVTTREQLDLLKTLGFNRLSMGVQDFTPEVQEAIARRQSEQQTRDLYQYARSIGFDSINVDLIYGLPKQRLETFRRTLDSVVDMKPDRIAVYSYAHVPWLRPHQKQIDTATLPDTGLKFDLFGAAIETFVAGGYEAIGMDHFALPGDDLAQASGERRLHRNFMGYTTRPAPDMLGVGVSAIGDVRGAFAQNVKKLPVYYAAIDSGRFPIERGYALSADDLIRRTVITELMCNFHVDRGRVEARFGIDFQSYFAGELAALSDTNGPVADGFLTIGGDGLDVTPRGRLFVRNICMAFDRYLPAHEGKPVFSRTI
ncbi:MAG: oxygen-independent coproporphyrinogen III oxidase [Acidobacteria bacterium RIFCSPLOWO2_02_FULL_67_36]|nr:MAG: oxygen-independent coproporphyrinogen III oxidase [Acidobacteria bacterium RIFCSPLOWO2_02_FULL_67_36]OFW24475.1 MAG: oxygen-independent coproporphyrinogen III oxidase [Acidobacteria bacterium RIFCSPLOWO2_12_FULL_66_21]